MSLPICVPNLRTIDMHITGNSTFWVTAFTASTRGVVGDGRRAARPWNYYITPSFRKWYRQDTVAVYWEMYFVVNGSVKLITSRTVSSFDFRNITGGWRLHATRLVASRHISYGLRADVKNCLLRIFQFSQNTCKVVKWVILHALRGILVKYCPNERLENG